jgi:hypothetical protein
LNQLLRNTIFIIELSLVFIVGFRLALHTPLNSFVYALEAITIVAFFCIFLYQLIVKLYSRKKIDPFLYLNIGMCLFPLLGSLNANLEFGQPMYHGLIHQRDFFLFLIGIVLSNYIKSSFELKQIELSFQFISWFSLAIFIVTPIFIDPEKYLATDFVGFNPLKGGYIYKFVMTFMVFGFLYYSILFFRNKRVLDALLSMPFLIYLIFIRQDRSIILLSLITFIFFFFKRIFPLNKIKYGLITLVSAVCFTLFLSVFETNYFVKFTNVITAFSGEETNEAATNIRNKEIAIALPYIAKNPYFGNGELSNQWNGGYQRLFGYFFPSDIGLIGEIYVFGIIGTLLLHVQFIFGAFYVRKTTDKKSDHFFIVLSYFLLYTILDSLTAGQTIFYAANSMIIISLLYSYYKLNSNSFTSDRKELSDEKFI